MHGAPSVMFPVGRCTWYGLGLAILAVVGGGALGAWFWFDARPEGLPWPGFAGLALWLIWVAFAAWTWRHVPTGHLRWHASERSDLAARGGTWYWHSVAYPDGAPLGGVERMLDLQAVVLLRLHNAGLPVRWVWAERARDPVQWAAVRRALVSAGA